MRPERDDRDRWCRCAQPPANGLNPSGIVPFEKGTFLWGTVDSANTANQGGRTGPAGKPDVRRWLSVEIETTNEHEYEMGRLDSCAFVFIRGSFIPDAGIPSGCGPSMMIVTGSVAALNHRLMA